MHTRGRTMRAIRTLALWALVLGIPCSLGATQEVQAMMKRRPLSENEISLGREIETAYLREIGSRGLQYVKMADAPIDALTREDLLALGLTPVWFAGDAEEDRSEPYTDSYDVFIDFEAVSEFQPAERRCCPGQVYHQALLVLGLHRICVRDPASMRVLYDGELLITGTETIEFRTLRGVETCNLKLLIDGEVVFERSAETGGLT